jgi:hypothetical protein
MIALNNEQAVKKSRVIRNTLIELRISGLTLKQAAGIVGITIATADWHWGKIRKLCGGATEGAIAAWAATTPRHLWIPVLMLVLCACKTQPVQQPPKPMLTPPIPQATVKATPRPRALVAPVPPKGVLLPPFTIPDDLIYSDSVEVMSSTNGGKTWAVAMQCGPFYREFWTNNVIDWPRNPNEYLRLRFSNVQMPEWATNLPPDWTAGKEGPQ